MKDLIVSAAQPVPANAPRSHADHVVITCEHGGNDIPTRYRVLFEPWQDLLATHRGYDLGALLLAEELAAASHAPLFASTTSRLLVDLNRSIGNPGLYSEVTRALPLAERRRIALEYWRPHRQAVESHVAAAVARGERVVHIASHSFTPELGGEVRNADIGLLYDPRRDGEIVLARLWKRALAASRPDIRVRLNYPYQGKGDGLTSTLRRAHASESYVGLEFELNQRHVVEGGAALRALRQAIVLTLDTALEEYAATTAEPR